MLPKLSVIMSVYNAGGFLREAVHSVLAQTFEDFEFIIIDDGSSDDSLAILREIPDRRLRIIQQENRGLIASLNRGIEISKGRYIARMDADDRCDLERFKLQVDYLDSHREIALLGGAISTMDENGTVLAPYVPFPATHEEIWAGIGRRPWVFCHPAVMFRRDAAIDVGMYHTDFAHAEDAEFFARLMTRYHAANLPQVLLQYRLRRTAVSFTKTAHGQINAQLVASMIDRWRPGERFAPTKVERRAADERIAACNKPAAPKQAEYAYQTRVGRELLRGRAWGRAMRNYAQALKTDPSSRTAYLGMACAMLHVGAAPRYAEQPV